MGRECSVSRPQSTARVKVKESMGWGLRAEGENMGAKYVLTAEEKGEVEVEVEVVLEALRVVEEELPPPPLPVPAPP